MHEDMGHLGIDFYGGSVVLKQVMVVAVYIKEREPVARVVPFDAVVSYFVVLFEDVFLRCFKADVVLFGVQSWYSL